MAFPAPISASMPNDTGQAVANSLAAVEAGVRQIQGTLNGIGERCGNANLVTLIPTLALKETYASAASRRRSTPSGCSGTSPVSHAFDELLNRSPDHQMPYVGASAFATKAGIHASALLKDPRTYEHVTPESVGNLRKVMVSDQGGKANFINALKRRGIDRRQGRSEARPADFDRQGTRGDRLCL
jgi:2-isopropylmalate synthase